jgi:DNA-binding NarL/FixJ family response regulator
MLGAAPGDRAAVILEEAQSPELAPLIADAYGLSARERSVTQLVAQGLATTKIASVLYLSPYTVQDHLKSTSTRSESAPAASSSHACSSTITSRS